MDDVTIGAIDAGLLALVGVAPGDGPDEVGWMADKISNLRVFPDDAGKMGRSVLDDALGVLLVSQFTLFGDVRKGRRPSFLGAAAPDLAAPTFDRLVAAVRALGVQRVETGAFGAHMIVSLVNDGPVTLVLDTP